MKKMYVAQPFEVGSKSAKSRSLALVIPHEVVKRYEIDTSTVIIIKTDRIGNCEWRQSKIFDTNENALAASVEKMQTSVNEH